MKIFNHLGKLGVSCVLLLPLSAFAAAHSDKKPLPAIDWQPCYTDINPNLLCAQYPVPLDYQSRKKNPRTIDIALIKLPANAPAQERLGSLFLNPGGPGGSGVDFVRDIGQYLYTQEVRDKYDLIGFDPRGISRSAPVTCGLTFDQLFTILPPFGFPLTHQQEQQKIKSDRTLASICAANSNEIINHMSTADVARDLDVLRQAVGDDLLHYAGYSYGSYLGVTYANLFPQKVGRMIVDGVIDPIAWSTGKGWSGWIVPVTTRLESDKNSMATLNEFFRLCDLSGPGGCSIAGNSAARFKQIAQRLKVQSQPIIFPDGSITELTYDRFISATVNALYTSPSWASFAGLMAYVEAQFPPEIIGQQYFQLRSELGLENVVVPDDNRLFGFPAVLCSDSDNPAQAEFWPLWADETEQQNGYFGRFWAWNSSICSHWPGSQKSRFTGPFNKKTKNPVLIASTQYDPATPYSGAQTLARLLPNSRLVTVAGWGHTTPGLSYCADIISVNYLLTGALPASDTLCHQDISPFPMPDGVIGSANENSSANKRSLARAGAVAREANGDQVRKAIIRSNQTRAF